MNAAMRLLHEPQIKAGFIDAAAASTRYLPKFFTFVIVMISAGLMGSFLGTLTD